MYDGSVRCVPVTGGRDPADHVQMRTRFVSLALLSALVACGETGPGDALESPDASSTTSIAPNETTAASEDSETTLVVRDQGQAGLPLDVSFSWSELAAGMVGGEVIAHVTDPAGVVRSFPLRDDGMRYYIEPVDGVYAALIWATDLAGTYQIEVIASGTTSTGAPVQRQAETEVTLGAKVDTDGDGVADEAELLFELNPNDPSDGNTDHDLDGLGLAIELAAGTDPASWDSDGGSENDRSEMGRGLDPLDANDDAQIETAQIGVGSRDGNLVSIYLATAGGTGSVRLYRFNSVFGDRTDLGLHPGRGAMFTDGPLPDGEYYYLAVTVTDEGAEGALADDGIAGPVMTAGDLTPPDFRITLNGGRWDITHTEVSITFTDLTEPAAEMRLALSEADLATTEWVPFKGFATIIIPAVENQHFVYAQVRDQAGNESRVASSFVFYKKD